ncbi:MAG: hypothetical protein MUF81_16795 [Verrucomicrobia bacterium]|jgi:hypothetical protein|nr:hypothetical protein [Verrucomicrobiota bacterium]
MSAPAHIKVECPFCGQHIEIPDALAADWITCPNESCGKSFPPVVKGVKKLDISPPVESPTPKVPPPELNAEPELIEELLENIGQVYLWAGLIGAGICLLILLANAMHSAEPAVLLGLFIGALVCAGQGFIVSALFRALAEIIRLLRANKPKP